MQRSERIEPMYIGAGALALIAFLLLWLTGHPVAGIVIALLILVLAGGGLYIRG